jgi:hypothetical protein
MEAVVVWTLAERSIVFCNVLQWLSRAIGSGLFRPISNHQAVERVIKEH